MLAGGKVSSNRVDGSNVNLPDMKRFGIPVPHKQLAPAAVSPACLPLRMAFAFPSACRSDNQLKQPRFGGRLAVIFGRSVGQAK